MSPAVAVRWLAALSALAGGGIAAARAADEAADARLTAPLPYQVVQRREYDPLRAHEHQPGGPSLGFAEVTVAGSLPSPANSVREYRVVPLAGAYGRGVEWTAITDETPGPAYTARVRVPAGGWYRLEVRSRAGDRTLAEAGVAPVGVGEVLVVAGQSYAAGANDELLRVAEQQGRVTAYDVVQKAWRVAHDPQPHVGDGGTIWPALGDALVPLLRVPVGFVNVAVGGTASRQWLPGESLYQALAAAGTATGRFRAVLWQQGESDVIEHVTTDDYVRNLLAIRGGLTRQWGFEPPWLPAKSTLHPTVYNDPEGEGRIRAGVDRLWRSPGFRPGPDTDTLGGENRGGPETRRHFSGVGQRRAALLWLAALWPVLHDGDADETGFAPLFDGRTLDGWEGDPKLWKVEDGALVGDSPGIDHNAFLATTRRYANFELRLEFRLRRGEGNSGIQFRSERVRESHEVSGYQADIGESYWGCLYDESRRNRVLAQAPAELKTALRPDDWNRYVIRAAGERITLALNGVTTVDYRENDPAIPRAGLIALQVHSGPPLRIEFRNLRLKELPDDGAR